MNSSELMIWCLYLVALFFLLAAGVFIWRLSLEQRAMYRISRGMQAREASLKAAASNEQNFAKPVLSLMESSEHDPAAGLQLPAWLGSAWGRALLADEDRALLDQAGLRLSSGGAIYAGSRVILALLFFVSVLIWGDLHGWQLMAAGFVGLGLGLMLPKWMLHSRVSKRRRQVVEELPLFIDLLRLLQGVGLSIDQSLHILTNEFGSVLPVLSMEVGLANRLYATGRNREKSLQRLIDLSADEDMVAVVNLIVQVDRHGGAVQEPLKQFSVRLRDKRQAAFKEKIGAITVKMTGVMVLTLLPALLVITAGPGFMAVIRSLSTMNRG